MPTSQVILSPHLDDAVFNCWSAINGPSPTVITIFAGIPPKETHKLWDLLCGEKDGARMAKERRAENKVALEGTKSTIVNMDYLDSQYRNEAPPEIEDIVRSILKKAPKNSTYLAPLALSKLYRHKDNVLAQQVGLSLLQSGHKVSFYPDSPFMTLPPEIIDGQLTGFERRVSKDLGMTLKAEIKRLDIQEQALKQKAMLSYESQYSLLNLASFGGLYKIARRDYELVLIPR